MKTQPNAKDIKEQTSITALLTALGYQPQRKSGQEQLYLSPLRDSDTKPSFSVNEKLGCWYDHGEGKGGNIIDFGIRYWNRLSFPEVLEKIVSLTGSAHLLPNGSSPAKRKRLPVKEPHYHILEIKDLGANRAITDYLESRGVLERSKSLLKEVYYYIEDQQKHRRNFFAAGWQNETGAWEISSIDRQKYCLGRKAISFIPGDPQKLTVFEGFFDYLSWLAENPFTATSVLVLNSVALVQSGIAKARTFEQVDTYFDNDESGKRATTAFQTAVPHSVDRANIYESYKDYNEMLVASLNGPQYTR